MSQGSELTDKDLSELMGWHHRAMFSGDQTGTLAARIRAVADAAAKKERQACAKECDKGVGSVGSDDWAQGYDSASRAHGAAIRARGQA